MHLRLIIVALVVIALASLALGATTTKKPGTTKAGATTKKAGTTKAGATTKKAGTTKAAAKTTTKTPVKCNCTNARMSIWDCIGQDSQKANMYKFRECNLFYNVTCLTPLLTGLKNSGCIKASAWADVQGWLTLITPPACYTKIIKGLTAQEKKEIKAYADETKDDADTDDDYKNVEDIISNKVAKLSAANQKAVQNWEDTFWEYCWEYYYYYDYSYSSLYSSS